MPTKKYLFIQRSAPGGKREPPSPTQMQQMYEVFNAWKEKFAENIVDMGGKLLPGSNVVTTGGVSDGPLVESKEIIGGFMIVAADSVDRAIEVARESPGLSGPGSSIEIREIAGP